MKSRSESEITSQTRLPRGIQAVYLAALQRMGGKEVDKSSFHASSSKSTLRMREDDDRLKRESKFWFIATKKSDLILTLR